MDILWDQIDEAGWQARVAGLRDLPLRQSWDYGAAMQRLGATPRRAVLRHAGREVALVQVMQRRGLRLINQGPIWLEDATEADKRCALRGLACHPGATIATPDMPLAGWGLIPLITGRSRALWQIGEEAETVRQGLHGKWRNRLRKAEAQVRPKPLRGAALEQLMAQEAAQRHARGYRNLPGALALHWPGQSLALGWHAEGALQAGMVFLIHGPSASYFLGWASARGRAAFAHGPLLWQAMLALRARGVQQLDLGDVDSGQGAALARFKLGTGAKVQAMGASCLVLPPLRHLRQQGAGGLGGIEPPRAAIAMDKPRAMVLDQSAAIPQTTGDNAPR